MKINFDQQKTKVHCNKFKQYNEVYTNKFIKHLKISACIWHFCICLAGNINKGSLFPILDHLLYFT